MVGSGVRISGAHRLSEPTYQAYRILHVGFAVLPILAGVDKFFNALIDWTRYVAPVFPNLLHVSKQTFMMGVGVIEVVAGLLVALYPKVGGYVVMLWLWGIILNLVLLQNYYDVALRDFGLSLGALALARLASAFPVARLRGDALPRT
ncbi:MAG: hypothetical protein H0W83_08520 [Planctomycetes bacterium]|nr:hypothetical protein [Planctomycetota bacterium]